MAEFNYMIEDNSLYDQDIQVVSDFVQSYQQSDNKIIQQTVLFYYLGRAYSYWNFLEQYIFGSDIENDIIKYRAQIFAVQTTFLPSNLESVRNKFPEYRILFDEAIQLINKDYEYTETVNISMITALFIFIGNIQCLGDHELIIGSSIKTGLHLLRNYRRLGVSEDRVYPLPNLNGHFGLNTYLYGYVNGIYLIGTPNKIKRFDISKGCPTLFMMHDIAHTHNISIKTDEHRDIISNIYQFIHQDTSLDKTSKELHIFVLWIVVHEIRPDNRLDTFFYLENNPIYLLGSIEFISAITGDFKDDLDKFGKYTKTDDNLSRTRDLVSEYQYPQKDDDNYRLSRRYRLIYGNNEILDADNVSLFLTMIYSWHYVRTNYLKI